MIETKYKFWRVIGPSLGYLFFAGLLMSEYFFKNAEPFDFEGFEFYELLVKPILYLPLLFFGFRDLAFNPRITFDKSGINFKRIKNLFIPLSEIKGFSLSEHGLTVITPKQNIFLRESRIKNFEEIADFIKNNYPSAIRDIKKENRTCGLLIIYFLGVLLISTIFMAFEIGGSLNWLKDKLPLKEIEVSNIEGTLSFHKRNQFFNNSIGFQLVEYPDFRFSYPWKRKLNDETNLLLGNRTPQSGQKFFLKIRTKDLKKLYNDSLGNHQKIRFYELTVENELLLRKKHIIDAK